MPTELNLRFPDANHVIVKFDDDETGSLDFASPINDEDRKDIRWYLEVYASSYTTDADDERAGRIAGKLPQWGSALFDAAFGNRAAQRLFNRFQDKDESGRLLTVSASIPDILWLPWELLRDTEGTYLVHDNPRISVRRNLAGKGGGRKPFKVKTKDRLHLLFVVSRPSDAGFIDPRSDPMAVMNALEKEAAARADVEFLRPATLDNLVKRLEQTGEFRNSPGVDILHFDGHGVFDADGHFEEKAKLHNPVVPVKDANGKALNTGYLLFEDKDGKKALITAETLGDMLNRQRVGLMVLSACQSAAVGGEDPMGSVAARLTHAGIPSVIAMTYSVLVDTTQKLFGAFYENLAYSSGIGEALDNARRQLYMHPERGERQRGENRITLKLYDWFLPTLYQSGRDLPLLTDREPEPAERSGWGNLPELQEAGFFGRTRELWDIEQAFVRGTRRISVSGFGGQGKTYLAVEAGAWLYRTGMFEKVCFVDYASFQGVDPVSMAVSTMSAVLEKNLPDAGAAESALKETRTLLILDNLESLQPGTLQELLSAAKAWSEAGKSRVLTTTRMQDFRHPDYPAEGSLKHIVMQLKGLGKEDCLAYFQSLMKLPPEPVFGMPGRDALLELFKLVDYHPLSAGLLAKQMKTRRIGELGKRLEELVKDTPGNPLLASLNLSLERLDDEARKWLPRLGVFQGGAMEDDLLEITEFPEKQWQALRPALETTGLIQPENLPGVNVPYLKFHPTLAPALWQRLSSQEQADLLARHRQQYYQLSGYLHHEDTRNPHQARSVVLRELANLLFAVHGALDAEEEYAVNFVNRVNSFLDYFGLRRDREDLSQRAQQAAGDAGSEKWFLARSNLGEQLYSAGRYREAAQVFEEVLAGLGETPSYERCLTLGRLGRCFKHQGHAAQAKEQYRRGLATAEKLEQSDSVKRHMGALNTELGDVLTAMGNYDGAKTAYEAGLAIAKEQNDGRQTGVVEGQFGTLAMLQGNLQEATQRYLDALTTFRQLNEPKSEAVIWNQLGRVHQEAKQWDAAEQAYRQGAHLHESQGNLIYAAQTWGNLALAMGNAGKPDEAETWYRKAIDAGKGSGDMAGLSKTLNNLANLLQTHYPQRLPEARHLAEEALAIMKTLDPGAAGIWATYNILAQIAEKQKDTEQAKEYRRLAREARQNFMGTAHQLKQHEQWMVAVIAAVKGNEEAKEFVKQTQQAMRQGDSSWSLVADAIDQILAGERDEDVLCEKLGYDHAWIINAILAGLSD
ncbi:MAG: tetratricopeptide repeat protein [Desulfobacterales bacterium]|nr:tetratricopeptide repeat protein [Desulfobacterales bacterium]